MYTYMYLHMHMHMYMYMCRCMYMYLHMHMHMHMYMCRCMYMYMYLHMYLHMHMHMYMYMYLHMHMHMYMYMCMYMYMYIYMYMYTYMYMYMSFHHTGTNMRSVEPRDRRQKIAGEGRFLTFCTQFRYVRVCVSRAWWTFGVVKGVQGTRAGSTLSWCGGMCWNWTLKKIEEYLLTTLTCHSPNFHLLIETSGLQS